MTSSPSTPTTPSTPPGPSRPQAQTGPARITVTGQGSAAQAPDIMNISVGIEARRASVPEAYAAAADAMRAILDRLRELGVGPQDTATSALTIRAESGWQEGAGNVVTGYLVGSALAVRLNYQDRGQDRAQHRAQDIVAAVVEAGGDDVRLNGLQPAISNPAPVSRQARENAWLDVRAKAEHYAALAGRALGRVHSISEREPSAVGPGPMPVMLRASSTGALPLEAGESTVDVSVSVTWELT